MLAVDRDLLAPERDPLVPEPDRARDFELEPDAGDDFEVARDADADFRAPLPDFRAPLPDEDPRAAPEPDPPRALDFREEPDDEPRVAPEDAPPDPELALDAEPPFEAEAPLVDRADRRRGDAEAPLLEDEVRCLDVVRRDPPLSFSTAIVVLPGDRDGCLLAAWPGVSNGT